MKPKSKLDLQGIAKALGAEREGTVTARSGNFGALQLVAEVQSRFLAPPRGGRRTDPAWTERRLVPLAPATLTRLEQLAATLRKQGVAVEPLQVAALLLEQATESANANSAAFVERARSTRRKSA